MIHDFSPLILALVKLRIASTNSLAIDLYVNPKLTHRYYNCKSVTNKKVLKCYAIKR